MSKLVTRFIACGLLVFVVQGALARQSDEPIDVGAEERVEVKLMLVEPRGVVNTGEEGGDRTAELDVWI